MSPLLWMVIDKVAKRHPGMSPTAILNDLQKVTQEQFKRLTSQVIGCWIDRSGSGPPRWSDKTLARVGQGNSPGGITTRVGILVST